MFGKILRALRQSASMTQGELADSAGISTAYVSALEGGRKPAPPRAVVVALASSLNVAEEKLWAPARRERELKLIQRIDGLPASSRTLADGESLAPHDPIPAEHESLLTDLFASIRAAALRTDNPVPLINSLRTLVEQISFQGSTKDE